MALGFTQPVTEMSNRNIFWGKGGRCVRLTTLPPLPIVLKCEAWTSWNTQDMSRPVMGLFYFFLILAGLKPFTLQSTRPVSQ
jgi:hypothetical protein